MKLWGGKPKEPAKRAMLKRIVRLCLALIVFITLASFASAILAGEQISSSTVTALMGGICGELLMSLSKRKHDDKIERPQNTTEPPSGSEEESI